MKTIVRVKKMSEGQVNQDSQESDKLRVKLYVGYLMIRVDLF